MTLRLVSLKLNPHLPSLLQSLPFPGSQCHPHMDGTQAHLSSPNLSTASVSVSTSLPPQIHRSFYKASILIIFKTCLIQTCSIHMSSHLGQWKPLPTATWTSNPEPFCISLFTLKFKYNPYLPVPSQKNYILTFLSIHTFSRYILHLSHKSLAQRCSIAPSSESIDR